MPSIDPNAKYVATWEDDSHSVTAMRDPQGDLITDHAILRRNVVHDCWGEGISTFEANGIVIEDNVVYDNWAQNLYVSDVRNAIIQRNMIYNTPGNLVGNRRAPFTMADERSDKPRSSSNRVINNFVFNAAFCAFCWTIVPGSGLDHALIANNTIVDGEFKTGPNSIASHVTNNLVIGTVSVPTASGLTFSHNLWAIHGLPGPDPQVPAR